MTGGFERAVSAEDMLGPDQKAFIQDDIGGTLGEIECLTRPGRQAVTSEGRIR